MTGSELNGVSTPLSEGTGTKYLTNNYYSKVLSIVKSRGVSNPKQREIDAFAYNLGVWTFSSSTLLDKYSS
jgi:GH24 family phage-related lysozyme (muramidase)